MKNNYKLLVVVLTVVFSMMLVAIFGTFSYLIYQKSAGNQSQNQFKEDMEIVLNDSEQEKIDESMNEEEITENEGQITESDDHLQPTPEPKKTETPEKNQGKQRSKEEIREKFFKEFINNQGALQVTDDEGQIVIYNRFYPGISAEFTYEEAEAFLDASTSEQQKIKNKAENKSKQNHLDLSYEIYLDYYNAVKTNLPENMAFQFYFEALNPWTSVDVEYSENEFWGVLTDEKPLYVNIMILLDEKQYKGNSLDLNELNHHAYEEVKENFAGHPIRVEVSSATADNVNDVEAYQLKRLFLNGSKSLHNVCATMWDLHEETDEVKTPGSGASTTSKHYYEEEKTQIRNRAVEVCADLGLDLTAADYDGKTFMLYSKSRPGISVELAYSDSESLEAPKLDTINYLMMKEDIYNELISCVKETTGETNFKLNSHFNVPSGKGMYSEDKEAFLEPDYIKLFYGVYVVFDGKSKNIDLDKLNEALAETLAEFYGNAAMQITINSVVSTKFDEIETYMLNRMFAYTPDQLGGEVQSFCLMK